MDVLNHIAMSLPLRLMEGIDVKVGAQKCGVEALTAVAVLCLGDNGS